MNKIILKRLITSTSIVFFIFTILILSRIDNRENFAFNDHEANELNGSWTIRYDDNELTNITLPYDLNLEANTTYQISTVLPQLDHNSNTLLLRSSMQDLRVFLDDSLIYEHIKPESIGIVTPPASLWVSVTLPDDYAGKILTIEMNSPIKSFSGVINPVMLDSRDILLFNLVKNQLFGLGIFGILFIAGMTLVIISFFIKVNEDSRILYLGLLATCTSLWILAETRLLQFFIGNRFILGSLAYLMVPLMAIYFALYVREAVLIESKHKKVITGFVYLMQIFIITSVLLQIAGIRAFIETMYFGLMIISVGALVGAYFMIVEIRDYHNETAKKLMKFTFVLFISVVLEIGSFYIGTFSYISSFLRIGSFLFFLLLIIDTIYYIRESMERRNETLILEKLAYKDFLTGGLNRTSYEKELEKMIDDKKTFRLNLLDLNYLKYINDNYGHNVGDEAIKLIYHALESAFKSIGTSYRIGGDEFAVIIDDTNAELNQNAIEQFNQNLNEVNEHFIYPLKVAIGTDVYTYEQWEQFSKFYHHVDQKMYEDKDKLKNQDDKK